MTPSRLSSFADIPTQRNRRLLLTLPACTVPLLAACGGGDIGYDTEQALYVVGEAITPNNPNWTGSTPQGAGNTKTTFSVWPALPAGLALNHQTGVISGTPTKLKRQGTHVVTAWNKWGVAEAKLRITVTGRGTGPQWQRCLSPAEMRASRRFLVASS